MGATTILLRLICGIILAGGLALWGGVPYPWGVILVVSAGGAAAVWGDKFLLGLMSAMKYFR